MNVMMSSIPTLSPALSLEGYGVDDVDLLLDALFAVPTRVQRRSVSSAALSAADGRTRVRREKSAGPAVDMSDVPAAASGIAGTGFCYHGLALTNHLRPPR